MRVALYPGLAEPTDGGSFTFVSEICRTLAARAGQGGHEFVVLAPKNGFSFQSACRGLNVLTLEDGALPISTLTRYRHKAERLLYRAAGFTSTPNRAADRFLAANEIDVVWYPSAWSYLTLDIPYLTTVWDLQHRLQPFFPEVSSGSQWDNRERHLSTVLRRASLVVTGTQMGRDEIERFYGVPRESILLLPHPTPQFVSHVQQSKPDLSGLQGEFLFYPAQFWSHKNHYGLIEALRLLRDRDGLDISLVLTGSDKGNLAYVRDLIAQCDLSSAVQILGFVPQEQLAWLYRHAFALTYVTYFGPENLPPLEAFATGCPVIASDVPGAREQLGDAALFVDPRRPEQIADAVRSLHSSPALRKQLVERGASRASRFTPDDFVSGIMNSLDNFEPLRKCWRSSGGAATGRF